MLVTYRLNIYSTDFDLSFKDCFWRYQKSLESGLDRVRKYTKCFIQSATIGLPKSVELVHKAKYNDADLPVNFKVGRLKLRYTNIAPYFMFDHFFPGEV